MSWSDVVNGKVVGRSGDLRKPTKPARGEWLQELFVNPAFDRLTTVRRGPSFQVVDGLAEYTYTVEPREEEQAKDLLKDYLNDEVIVPAMTRQANSGTTVEGMAIGTTDGDLAVVMGELDDARGHPGATRKFKGRTRAVRGELTLTQIEAIAAAIRDHKRAANAWAFDRSEEMEAIEDLEALKAFRTTLEEEVAQL